VKEPLFPKKFFWGVSTASHQVEGRIVNQWSVWELAHAKHLAKTAEARLNWLPDWPRIKKQAEDPNNYVSGHGVEHVVHYKSDIKIAKKLQMNAFRFGIEWSRLEPVEGQWDDEAIEYYREYIKELKSQGLEPFLNIWHWTVPTWFHEKGAFSKGSNVKYFEKFVQKIADEYAHDIRYVLTINEPNVYTSFGYVTGEWPPGQKSLLIAGKVIWNLVRSHKSAYRILKSKNPRLQIGVATQLSNIQAKRPRNLFDEFSVKWMRYFWNWWFLNRIKNQQDFVGFNYYFSDYYTGLLKRENPKVPVNDLGWYMEPEGLYALLLRVWAHYKKPIIITENGVADEQDQFRRWWLEETIIAMERAISEGVDVRGYFHWSLLDNFEWAYGWWPKFGLVAVDRKNSMKRTIRPSAVWLAKKIASLQ
jgi:beta-glucosidase